jgi:pulcherriminic acid synthase
MSHDRAAAPSGERHEHDDDPAPAAGYRSYEVYQRERVDESSTSITPRRLIGDEMLSDPFHLLELVREHEPCYRDWVGNRFWITRYDDVTSVFTDEANYETRSKRWRYGRPDAGRDLGTELPVLEARANRIDDAVEGIVERILHDLDGSEERDLATGFAARLPLELWGAVLDLPRTDLPEFSARYWRMQRGHSWDTRAQHDGLAAIDELVAYIDPLLAERRADPGDDLISAVAGLEVDSGTVTASDIVATILEADHETLHGGLANLWLRLLTDGEQLAVVRDDRRLVKFAWLEALRHSPPVLSADRFSRHEVERFGRLIPEGALLTCSAAGTNRDPRVFDDPESFVVERRDLCQREPRGQYRADGLPSGIAFGLGPPSRHPAVPKERPRSIYAITRDVAVTASQMLLDAHPDIRLAPGCAPTMRSLRLGEMHTCWALPVTW